MQNFKNLGQPILGESNQMRREREAEEEEKQFHKAGYPAADICYNSHNFSKCVTRNTHGRGQAKHC